MTPEDLYDRLVRYKVPVDRWGLGNAKTLKDLQEEINKKECEVILDTSRGELVRVIKAVTVKVRYIDPTTHHEFHLVEEKQVFKDRRQRSRNTDDSIGEKMRPGENIIDAVRRALFEELGMGFIDNQPVFVDEKIVERPSLSYPGLLTRYYLYQHDMLIGPEQFEPKGYVEEGPNLTTYFVWKEVPPSQNE